MNSQPTIYSDFFVREKVRAGVSLYRQSILLGKKPAVSYCVHKARGKPMNSCRPKWQEQRLPGCCLFSFSRLQNSPEHQTLVLIFLSTPTSGWSYEALPKFHAHYFVSWQPQMDISDFLQHEFLAREQCCWSPIPAHNPSLAQRFGVSVHRVPH